MMTTNQWNHPTDRDGNFDRAEMDEMMKRWVEANAEAERLGDWANTLGPFYLEDAQYSWNLGPDEEFVARGVDQIKTWALGEQMEGFDGWKYPYDKVLIDEVQGEVVVFWRQIAPTRRPDGSAYEVAGIGGSWFKYAGNFKWSRQRDFFDFGNVMSLFLELAADGELNSTIKKKIQQVTLGKGMVGHEKLPTRVPPLRKLKGYLAMARIAVLGQ